MPRSIVLGNGNILIGFDNRAQVRDIYFPYVGLENHTGGHLKHRVGIWVDGHLSWLSDHSWDIQITCNNDALVSEVHAVNKNLKVELNFSDLVYNEKNIFIRKVVIKNNSDREREIKLFFNHQFEIYESHRGDTAYFDPRYNSLIHYNGRRVFFINGKNGNEDSFSEYTTGVFNIEGKEGSHKDAEDGFLSKNPIEHGPTDSVIGFYNTVEPNGSTTVYYWMTIAETIPVAKELNDYVLERGPEHLMRTSSDYWSAWINKRKFNFHDLNDNIVDLFKKSLIFMRVHADNHGAIIASGDSDMLQNGKDTYGYMWPRDAAYCAIALDGVGDFDVSRRFFEFSNEIILDDGYFMHKYRPDKSLGSSWHPWVRNGKMALPIQEGETAIVIDALWRHYRLAKDLEFIENIYNSLIKKAADFLESYRDETTGLPKPTYDLWEEKYGISTYTSSVVYRALMSASNFANILGKDKSSLRYRNAAEQIRSGILNYLYNKDEGNFYKLINIEGGKISYDKTLDVSSLHGIVEFGILDPFDERVVSMLKQVEERLSGKTLVGGISRYEGDEYYRIDKSTPGNPWIMTTLWLAQYYISIAKNEKDFDIVKEWLNWTSNYAAPSGVLPEQLNPHTGEHVSASPLAWSHAEFVITVLKYLDKLEELGLCDDCDPMRR